MIQFDVKRVVLSLSLVVFLWAVGPQTGFSQQTATFSTDYKDSYPKNAGIDIQGYVFELELNDENNFIQGKTTVEARFVAPGQSKLELDLIKKSTELEGKGMQVSGVTFEGSALRFTHENDRIVITLPRQAQVNELIRVQVTYAGIPNSGLKIDVNKHGDRAFFSDNWSSRVRNWLPTVDHPYDKAKSEFIVIAPDHYQVVSNGILMEETGLDGGRRLTHWKNSVPIATWLYMLGVSNFAVQYVDEFDGKSIQTWVARQDRDAGFYDFAEPTKKVLQYYTDLIGPYSYEKLANIVSNATGGGMEAASAIAYSEASVSGNRDRRWQIVIIHEIAHQWFGNAVTEADWNDVWLSEGFATYYTLLYREHAWGHDDFIDGLKDARNRVVNFYKNDYDFQIVRDYLEDLNDISGAMMYQKGAWVLHMVRDKIGIDNYNKGIQSYYEEYQDLNASTIDLIRHLEEASGVELDGYFQQWLRQGGIPHFAVRWVQEDGRVLFGVRQTQEKYVYDTEVDVQFRFKDGTLSDITTVKQPVVDGNAWAGVLSVPCEKEVAEVIVDPKTRLLGTWDTANERADWLVK